MRLSHRDGRSLFGQQKRALFRRQEKRAPTIAAGSLFPADRAVLVPWPRTDCQDVGGDAGPAYFRVLSEISESLLQAAGLSLIENTSFLL